MIYVTSDLHGYPLDNFLDILYKSGFGKNSDDYMFVLGDVIDRGDDGVEILQWLLEQTDVQLILGNHEAMMMSCRWLFDEITEETLAKVSPVKLELMSNWIANGGEPTIRAMRELLHSDPEAVVDIFDYLDDCPLYDTVFIGDRRYLFTHSGLGGFSKDKKITRYTSDELLWNRPSPDDRYFSKTVTVFGHTPTGYLVPENDGRILVTDTWINIDTGAASGKSPCVLRLDDMAEFYM